jgi:hypothetical protein
VFSSVTPSHQVNVSDIYRQTWRHGGSLGLPRNHFKVGNHWGNASYINYSCQRRCDTAAIGVQRPVWPTSTWSTLRPTRQFGWVPYIVTSVTSVTSARRPAPQLPRRQRRWVFARRDTEHPARPSSVVHSLDLDPEQRDRLILSAMAFRLQMPRNRLPHLHQARIDIVTDSYEVIRGSTIGTAVARVRTIASSKSTSGLSRHRYGDRRQAVDMPKVPANCPTWRICAT